MLSGYGQRRFAVAMGVRDLAFYESELRPALEHLLAAHLAERHGVNLYTQPGAARKVFCRTARDEALWRWIDPARESQQAGSGAEAAGGIPRRVLTRLGDILLGRKKLPRPKLNPRVGARPPFEGPLFIRKRSL